MRSQTNNTGEQGDTRFKKKLPKLVVYRYAHATSDELEWIYSGAGGCCRLEFEVCLRICHVRIQ